MAETILRHAEEFETDFIMYTSTFCPYCTAAKRLLKQKDLSFTEVNFDVEPDLRFAVVKETGHRTVPVIIDNRGEQPMFIGGFDETNRYLNK